MVYLKQLWQNVVFEIPQIMYVQRLKFLGTTTVEKEEKKKKLSMKAKHIP